MITVLLFCCLRSLCAVIYQLEQSFRSGSKYDYVREDGVRGKEVALVRWILVDSCDGGLDECTRFLCQRARVTDIERNSESDVFAWDASPSVKALAIVGFCFLTVRRIYPAVGNADLDFCTGVLSARLLSSLSDKSQEIGLLPIDLEDFTYFLPQSSSSSSLEVIFPYA